MTTAFPRPNLLPFAMLVLMLVLAALDQTVLSTALPVIARELPGHWPLPWLFSAYLLTATVVIALYGRLADVLGRKPMLLLAIGLFLLGSLACGSSQDLQQLIVARALQGAGGGGLLTLTMLAVADLVAPQQRGRFQGLLGAAYGVSTMFGPLLGGTLVEHLSWHWAFWLNVPLAALAFGVLARTLPAAGTVHGASAMPAERMRVDWLGAVLLAAALVSLLLATQHDRLRLPEQLSLGMLLALGATSTLAFVWRQHRALHPLLPLSLFAHPAYAAVSCIGLATGVALYAAVVFVPQYLQTGLQLSPTASAWHLLPLMGGITAAAVASGKLLRAQKPAAWLAYRACALMVLSFGLIDGALRWLPTEPLALSGALLPLGLGLGLLFPIVTMTAQRVSAPQHTGIATAATMMLRSLGGAAGVALLATLLTRVTNQDLAAMGTPTRDAVIAALGHGLQAVFGCAAGVALLALLACRWLRPAPSGEQLPTDALRRIS